MNALCRFIKTRAQFFVGLSVLLSSNSLHAQQWNRSTLPHPRHVNSVKLLDTLHVVVAGGNESNDKLQDIFLSPDKGLTWNFSRDILDAPWIKATAFSDTSHGLAAGYEGVILKTNDGANSWMPVVSPTFRNLNAVGFVNTSVVFAAGGSKPGADTMQIILKSIDSGNTWSIVRDTAGFWFKGIDFSSATNGIAVGDNGVIFRTTDAGAHWNKINPPAIRNFNAVKFLNTTTGFIAGGIDYIDPFTLAVIDSFSTILRTTDGGATWNIIKDDSDGMLTAISFINANTGYAVGGNATVLKTINGGLNWTHEIIPNTESFDYFNSVDFNNNNFGVIGGKFGSVYIYTPSALPTVYTYGSQFIDSTTFILSGGVNTHGEQALYTFYYALHPNFYPYLSTSGTVINNNLQQVDAAVTDLLPDTTYYFYLEAQTLAGITHGNTLSFFTERPKYIFQTDPAVDATNTTVTLNGFIDKFPTTANLTFEYGTSPTLGSEVAAVPSTINDTLPHNITAHLTGLTPNTIYYFRLKGMQNLQPYYGQISSFFTGIAFDSLSTLPVSDLTDSSARPNGYMNKFRQPVNLTFEYGTTPAFGLEAPAYPSVNNDTLPHDITGYLTNLQPATTYYFRLKAQTPVSIYYGETLSFNTKIQFTELTTLDASQISNTSAQLNATASGFHSIVGLSFDYGTSLSFGNSIGATPATITDSLSHSITANVSGLLTNQLYYYRVRASTGNIDEYGKTKQFFTGEPEIPNWDFQYWDSNTVYIPDTWKILLDTFQRVPGHSGNYALRLSGQTFAITGFIGNMKDFIGGVSFTATSVPDSLIFFSNYNIETGDTALVVLIFKNNSRQLAFDFFKYTGNSAGAFQRKSFKISYDSIAVPDSIIIGFITSNLLGGISPFYHNYVAMDDISFTPNGSFANSNFENWFASTIVKPVSWAAINYVGLDPAHPNDDHMTNKVFFNPPDDFAAEIHTEGFDSDHVLPAEITTRKNGVIDDNPAQFAVRGKHVSLNGYFKFFPMPGDTLNVTIDLVKNHAEVGNGGLSLVDSVSDFTPFSIPINYITSDIPDSGRIDIRIFNSHLQLGSKFVVDKLSFDGFATSVKTTAELLELDGMKVYPNPARDMIIVENILGGNKNCTLSIYSINGEIIKEIDMTAQRFTRIDVNTIPAGMYILLMKKGDEVFNKKIVIQK